MNTRKNQSLFSPPFADLSRDPKRPGGRDEFLSGSRMFTPVFYQEVGCFPPFFIRKSDVSPIEKAL
jgi:hypothetical protein